MIFVQFSFFFPLCNASLSVLLLHLTVMITSRSLNLHEPDTKHFKSAQMFSHFRWETEILSLYHAVRNFRSLQISTKITFILRRSVSILMGVVSFRIHAQVHSIIERAIFWKSDVQSWPFQRLGLRFFLLLLLLFITAPFKMPFQITLLQLDGLYIERGPRNSFDF